MAVTTTICGFCLTSLPGQVRSGVLLTKFWWENEKTGDVALKPDVYYSLFIMQLNYDCSAYIEIDSISELDCC